MGNSIYKKAEKMQEKLAQKNQNKSQTANEILGIKSLGEANAKGVAQQFGYNLHQSWYFEKWYEKLILIVLCVLGLWRIVMFF